METKSRLLSYLKQKKGAWVSGEYLSGHLQVTRSAVWKQVRRLREEGYVIRSSPRKGYLLLGAPELLLPHEIRENLPCRSFGRQEIVYCRETESTNSKAKELAAKGAPEGTLVVAEAQTGGRGRRGRTWYSPSGEGIYATVILRPRLSLTEAPKITFMAAVAAAEALMGEGGLEVSIKWPNDVIAGGKKIAGILVEIGTEMDVMDFAVVGLGLNVHTRRFPPELRGKATSFFLEAGKTISRVRLLQEYLGQLEKYYTMSKETGFTAVLDRWRELADLTHRLVEVDLINSRVRGRVRGINGDGALILEDDQGNLNRILSGDLILLDQRRQA